MTILSTLNPIINAIIIITNNHTVTSNSKSVKTTIRVLLGKQVLSLNETDLDNYRSNKL